MQSILEWLQGKVVLESPGDLKTIPELLVRSLAFGNVLDVADDTASSVVWCPNPQHILDKVARLARRGCKDEISHMFLPPLFGHPLLVFALKLATDSRTAGAPKPEKLSDAERM